MSCPVYGGGSCGSTSTTSVTHTTTTVAHHAAPHALAFTGGDVVGLILLAVILIAAGLALRFCARRARTELS